MDENKKVFMGEEEINLAAYLDVILRRGKTILAITGCAFVISIVAALLLPKEYEATVSVMPPKPEDSISMGLAAGASGIGGLASGVLGIKSPSDLWVGVLQSRNVKDAIIERFGLRERYGTGTIEDTRDELSASVAIHKTKEEIIKVSVLDEDPETAAKMANAFIEELDRVNRSSVMTSGARTRAFLEKRLDEAKTELSKVEDAIRAFQERNKAIKLDDQSKAVIDAIGSVKGQLMAKEVELDTLMDFATDSNPKVQLLEAEVKGLRVKMRELERGGVARTSGGRDIFIPTDRIPDLSFQFVRLLRDAKVQETLVELLTQQYEIARIQEAKDSPTVQVLDPAKTPEKKARPRIGRIVAISTMLGAVFSVFLAFAMEFSSARRGGSLKL